MAKNKNATYIAFEDSEKLWKNSEIFIANIREKTEVSQIPILVEVMHDFLDEVIDIFILKPCTELKVQGTLLKLLNLSVTTIKKTCHFLSRRVLQKMKNQEVVELAEYMDKLLVLLPNQAGKQVGFTAIPITDDLAKKMHALIEKVSIDSPRNHINELIDILFELRDVVSLYLYQNTLERLQVGRVARKLIESSYITVKKATQTPITKLVPSLTDEQLLIASQYFKDMIVEGPPHKDIYG